MDEVQAEDIMEHLIEEAQEWWNELESEEAVNIYLKTACSKTSTEDERIAKEIVANALKMARISQKEHKTKLGLKGKKEEIN